MNASRQESPSAAGAAPVPVNLGAPAAAPTMDRLLDTAAALFWEKGYAATTTREIAAAVGIQQASLYHHVASKEELLHQICMSSLQEFRIEVQAAVNRAASPPDRIGLLIRAHVTTLLRHQKRNATMLTEMRSLSRRHREDVLALREAYARFVRSTFEDARAAGRIRSDIPAKYLCLALLNMLNWAALWFRQDQALSPDELSTLFVRVCLEGVACSGARGSLPSPELEGAPRKAAPRARKLPKTEGNGTPRRLLDAAAALFSRQGYAATSTREVAALLGIQKASLYYHIESKEDLLFLICKSSLERIHSDVQAAVSAAPDPLERTCALIRAHIESMLRDADEHSVTLSELHALSARRRAQILSLRHGYEDLVRSVLQDAQRAGALRDDIDGKFLCLALLGLLNRVLVWHRRNGPLAPSQLAQLLAIIFLTGAYASRPVDRLSPG